MKIIKKFVLTISLGFLLLNPTFAIAQTTSSSTTVPEYKNVDSSLTSYLCTPSENGTGRDLEQCVNKLYRFGIAFGAIALVFFLVFAGYLYITGGTDGKLKGKAMLLNGLVGMGLLLGSYVLLRFINPELVVYKPIQPPIFSAADLPSCEAVGFGEACAGIGGANVGGGTCTMPITASAVKSYNNTVHNPWDNLESTPDRHRTVRQPPNAPPPEGAVDLVVGQTAAPVYAPVTGIVTKRVDMLKDGTGGYLSISSNTTGNFSCETASGCANMAHITPSVNVGDMVQSGQQVGVVFLYPGGAGRLGPHLHLELKINGKWIVGDGKKGTWDNMKSAISQCGSNSGASSSTVAVDMSSAPSGMVEVTEASHKVKINMKYATNDNFTGTVMYKQNKCYLTQSMSNNLKKAQEALTKKGKTLELLDCYRPRAVQNLMVAWAKGKVDWAAKQSPQPNNYLTVPYIATNGDHPLGKAVDITIVGASMPSEFDKFSTQSRYASSNPDAVLLRSTMTNADFLPFDDEWWHFKSK